MHRKPETSGSYFVPQVKALQLSPDLPDPPDENAEIFFSTSGDPQLGHRTEYAEVENTKSSNSCPHLLHLNSNIGIVIYLLPNIRPA